MSQYKLVGTRVPRIDIPDKVTGTYTYVHNIRVPGCCTAGSSGRAARARMATGTPIVSVDESSIKHIPDVQVVRKGDFLGVVAPKEYDAIQAAAQLKVKWAIRRRSRATATCGARCEPTIVSVTRLRASRRSAGNKGNVASALASAAHVVSQTYAFSYNSHAPIGPGCSVADVTSNGALVMSHTQDTTDLRTAVSQAYSDCPRTQFVSRSTRAQACTVTLAGSERSVAAAVMSQVVGKPVRVQFMRWDEHGWDNYGAAQLVDFRGGIDANGNIVGYDFTTFAVPYSGTSDDDWS